MVLATCAGALRAYLCDLGRCPDEPLVAAVPVSVRGTDERGTMGNRLSAMLVGLGTQIEDPVARLIAICEGTRQAKAQNRLIAPTTLSELARLRRRERDAVLVGLDLLGNADLHGGSPYLVDRLARLRRSGGTPALRFRG